MKTQQQKPGTSCPIVFLNSHPIQYFAPLYQYLNQEEQLSCTALYCSAHGLKGEFDQQFGTAVQWDLPILEAYPSVFLKNYSLRPSIYGFWGLLNWGIVAYLYKAPRSIVIVHGWNYATHWLALLAARCCGHLVCLRAETPAKQELQRSALKRKLRQLFFTFFFRPTVNFFLPIGSQNEQFYQLYKVPTNRLLKLPYAVDNARFRREASQWAGDREQLCAEWGIDPRRRIFLFVGKFMSKKRPLDLLKAYAQLADSSGAALMMVGEGALRAEMEQYLQDNNLEQVVLTGFVNQGQIARYYAAADVFVMCSEQGETWGLAVNEAQNFALPIIVSDLVGCAEDLVVPGKNGYIFPCGQVEALKNYLDLCLLMPEVALNAMGQASLDKVEAYSFAVIAEQLQKIQQQCA